MKNEELKFITRQQLADKMGISTKTLGRIMITLKEEILKIDPLFEERKMISPKASLFIFYEYWPTESNNSFNER